MLIALGLLLVAVAFCIAIAVKRIEKKVIKKDGSEIKKDEEEQTLKMILEIVLFVVVLFICTLLGILIINILFVDY